MTKLKNLLLKNHHASFNQTWCKVSLGEVDSSSRLIINYEIAKNYIDKILNNLLLQNHWANFNHTWHKASFGEGPFTDQKGDDCVFTCVAKGESRSRSRVRPSIRQFVCPSTPKSCHCNSSETTDPMIIKLGM